MNKLGNQIIQYAECLVPVLPSLMPSAPSSTTVKILALSMFYVVCVPAQEMDCMIAMSINN